MREPTPLQREIMQFVKEWVNTEKSPIPRNKIVKSMSDKGFKDHATINAIYTLTRKKYIRRTRMIGINKTFYVMLRNI